MGYTKAQSKRLAKQIRDRFGEQIFQAVKGSDVEESFLAAFIGVEAGKDRRGQIVPTATRFERGVYSKLRALRDGLRSSYQRIRRSQILKASDAALRSLATSYGLTQIMGWHLINNLDGNVSELRDPGKHLDFAVALLELVGGRYLKRRDYKSVLRIWNTGSANGKTYHRDYVANALEVKEAYEKILETNPVEIEGEELDDLIVGIQESAAASPANPVNLFEAENPETEDERQTLPAANSETPSKPRPSAEPSPISEDGKKKFTAYVPQIDTFKTWSKWLLGGGAFSAVAAWYGDAPVELKIFIGALVLLIAAGIIFVFVKYHEQVFAYVLAMNQRKEGEPVIKSLTKGVDIEE